MFFREIASLFRRDFGEPPPKQYIATGSIARGQLCKIVGGQYVVPVEQAAQLERDLEGLK